MMAHGYENTPVLRQFEAAMERRGLEPLQKLLADGCVHRCNTKQKKNRGDGSYLLHLDGVIPAGGFQNWQDGQGWEDWSFDPGRKLTNSEREEIRRKAEAAAKVRDQTKIRDRERSQKKAGRLWEAAVECKSGHPYLTQKGLSTAHGARLLYGNLVVPVRDVDGVMQSLQFIYADGRKQFLKGGAVSGHFHRLPGASRICICEGFGTGASINEAAGATVIVAFDAGNLKSVAEAVRKQYPDGDITIAADDDWKRKGGNIGIEKATEAARTIGAKLAVPNFGINRREKDKDFNDLANFIGPEAVKHCIDAATAPAPAPESIDHNAEIERLARLSDLEYARVRKDAAKKLGVTVGALDKAVKAAKGRSEKPSGPVYAIWNVEPWPDPVDGAELLDVIAKRLAKHVKLPKHADVVIALWIVFAWAHDAFTISPLLTFSSPTHRCGKTTAIKVIRCLVPRPMPAVNLSGPVSYRAIEAWQPTLLCDEADKVFAVNDDLRIIFNSGHDRDMAGVPRCEGDDYMPRVFSTWAPKVVGLIGQLPGTLSDRSIAVSMQRKPRSEKLGAFRGDDDSLRELRSRAARWSADNIDTLRQSRPPVPDALNDRDADNWLPLLAVADAAGGDLPSFARDAALALSGASDGSDETRIRLIRDIKSVCTDDRGHVERISTEKLIGRLTADPEMLWADFHGGKPITANQLAKLLKPFGLASQNLRFDDGTQAKGYNLQLFAEVWQRYLDDVQTPSSADSALRSRPAVPDPTATDTFAAFGSRPSDPMGRPEKREEVQDPSHLGRRDGAEPENRANEDKRPSGGVEARSVATTASSTYAAPARAGADRAGGATPDHQDRPQCARCGDRSGTLKPYPVRMADGMERSTMLHPECWLALAKWAQKKAASSGGGIA